MTDATTAAKDIQARHGTEASTSDSLSADRTPRMLGYCAYCTEDKPCPDQADAGFVLAQLSEAIAHLEAIYDELGKTRSSWARIQEDAVAALACLRGEDA